MKPPTKVTLKKYGLTLSAWWALFDSQERACGLCGNDTRQMNIDHIHTVRWKKMKPDQRVQWVRSILCNMCNRFLLGPTRYGFRAEHYRMAADYLERWAARERALREQLRASRP